MSLICEKSVIKARVSRCTFCNSPSYGKGCRYAPGGIHFHPDDPKKCSYCGSLSYGKGCKLNPQGELHLHGISFNSMFNESIQNQFLLNILNKDYTEFEAYNLGIIDENGNKIKEPVTESEKQAYSPATRTYLKIKRYLGPKLDLINQTIMLESYSKTQYNKENHVKLLKYEEKINELLTQLHELTNTALSDGLSLEQVESMFR